MQRLDSQKPHLPAAPDSPVHSKPRVAIVYTHFPHYRRAVFEALRTSERYEYQFFYDRHGVDPTIQSAHEDQHGKSLRTLSFCGLMIQPAFLQYCLGIHFDAYIFLGNPYILSTWLYAPLLRMQKGKVAFWTHGWIGTREGLKGTIRSIFYQLADILLLYGTRAKEIGKGKRFPPERMHVIYNSLDYAAQQEARGRQVGKPAEISGAYFLCVSRLVSNVQLELAIEAAANLSRNSKSNVQLVIVGDGPERQRLMAFAAACKADVRFLGPIYDEDRLAGLFMNSLAVVSPGKVGLLAMHSMAYGTSVITHDDLDLQMPESEAIQPPTTGLFFRRGDLDALCEAMSHYLGAIDMTPRREEAINTIEARYTPEVQRELIERAIAQMLQESYST
ncbi:glycosyltransferase family 4 protein [Mesorhizobium sp.]|uniref:glycosyltransferase family 4 protein n=1 Tax=Mesorhizobium sp. TaxID=1871066 RepID=UPI000FE4A8A8|nr:glycosyltransferase family 4 protein [Mesorhizobium sp.]RWM75507.1 MAG: glycosyltransferase [Mesorhizobium sp.]TIO23336.1 MAG: glycosyltransferase family 4 protein [Mesorhizobium sp.]TJV61453.1 MAG: glycosyltransferase family 4 protein [Mesorhizobium sp.]